MKKNHTNEISSFAAKTHFSHLLQRVKDGEKFTITKHNTPIAFLIPSSKSSNTEEAISNLLNFKENKRLKGLSLNDMRCEGRR